MIEHRTESKIARGSKKWKKLWRTLVQWVDGTYSCTAVTLASSLLDAVWGWSRDECVTITAISFTLQDKSPLPISQNLVCYKFSVLWSFRLPLEPIPLLIPDGSSHGRVVLQTPGFPENTDVLHISSPSPSFNSATTTKGLLRNFHTVFPFLFVQFNSFYFFFLIFIRLIIYYYISFVRLISLSCGCPLCCFFPFNEFIPWTRKWVLNGKKKKGNIWRRGERIEGSGFQEVEDVWKNGRRWKKME